MIRTMLHNQESASSQQFATPKTHVTMNIEGVVFLFIPPERVGRRILLTSPPIITIPVALLDDNEAMLRITANVSSSSFNISSLRRRGIVVSPSSWSDKDLWINIITKDKEKKEGNNSRLQYTMGMGHRQWRNEKRT
jgi:hypothetical protein